MSDWFRERNVTWGFLPHSELWQYPKFTIRIGPIVVTSDSIEAAGWDLNFRQKTRGGHVGRAKIRCAPSSKNCAGLSIEIGGGQIIPSWYSAIVLLSMAGEATNCDVSSKIILRSDSKPVQIVDALRKHNAEALEALQGWRPEPPDMSNVARIEEFVRRNDLDFGNVRKMTGTVERREGRQ